MRRLRPAEWVALLASIGLAVTLGLDWFSAPAGVTHTGFDALPWLVLALVLLCIALNAALWLAFAVGAVDVFNLVPGVALAVLAPLTTALLLLVTLLKPGDATGIEAAGWAGLACALLMTGADLASLRDERRTGYGRVSEPPPARPAPPG